MSPAASSVLITWCIMHGLMLHYLFIYSFKITYIIIIIILLYKVY